MRSLGLMFLLLLAGCASNPEPRVYFPDPLPQFSGVVTGQVELSGELVMVDDVRVTAGSSLTIHPGTTIWVRPAESTKIDPEYLSSQTELLVQGTLRVMGNREAPVRFIPLKPLDPVAVDDPLWAGITFLPGSVAELSRFELMRADSGLLLQGAEGTLSGGRLVGCRNAVTLQNGARLTVDQLLVDGGETGLFCWGDGVVAASDSRFYGLDEEGIYLGRGCRARFREVVSEKNDTGLIAAHSSFPGLVLEQNRTDFRRLRSVSQ